MQKFERILWFILISFIVFCVIPLFGYIGSENFLEIYAKICVFGINLIYTILAGMFITKIDGFRWYYSIIIGLVFAFSALLIYNFSTIYFSIIYLLIELISSLVYSNFIKTSGNTKN